MGSLIFGAILAVIGLVVVPFLPLSRALAGLKKTAATVLILGGVGIAGMGGIAYNDAGYCQHIRNVFGTESSTCDTGWYPLMWGSATQWPHVITVTNTDDPDAQGSSINGPYTVRLADNWTGDVTQATRFSIPQDSEQFIKMARIFRSPERLITTTLKPAVTSSLDSISSLFTMEQYWTSARDAYKTEYLDAVSKGRARVRQVEETRGIIGATGGQASSDLDVAADTANLGETETRILVMEKVLDASGAPIRVIHDYAKHGIEVQSAILEGLDPDDLFEEQIQKRKDAAARRVIAQEERREQEEQRFLAIAAGETNIAKRQAAAREEQIQQTTDAETQKKLALIAAERLREEAEIARETAAINLERARIDAETKQTLADAEAYEREVILAADNALQQKLDAWVEIQREWAQAAADINVPATVFNMGGGAEGASTGNFASVEAFMSLLTANAAQQLALDPSVEAPK